MTDKWQSINPKRQKSFLRIRGFFREKKPKKISQFIQAGSTTKDIEHAIRPSTDTIHTHRKHIRKKLGLNGRPIDLFAFLKARDSALTDPLSPHKTGIHTPCFTKLCPCLNRKSMNTIHPNRLFFRYRLAILPSYNKTPKWDRRDHAYHRRDNHR